MNAAESYVILKKFAALGDNQATLRDIKLALFSDFALDVDTIKTLLASIKKADVRINDTQLAVKFASHKERFSKLGLLVETPATIEPSTPPKFEIADASPINEEPPFTSTPIRPKTENLKLEVSGRSASDESPKRPRVSMMELKKELERAKPVAAVRAPKPKLAEPIIQPTKFIPTVGNLSAKEPRMSSKIRRASAAFLLPSVALKARKEKKTVPDEYKMAFGTFLFAACIALVGIRVNSYVETSSANKSLVQHLLAALSYEENVTEVSYSPLPVKDFGWYQGSRNYSDHQTTVKAIINAQKPMTVFVTAKEKTLDGAPWIEKITASDFNFRFEKDGTFFARGNATATVINNGEEETHDLKAELTGTFNIRDNSLRIELLAYTKGATTDANLGRIVSYNNKGEATIKFTTAVVARNQTPNLNDEGRREA